MSQVDIKQMAPEPRNIDQLELWVDNPRKTTRGDVERLKEQIKRLGVYKPVLVNQDNIVLGGNNRIKALRELGVTGEVFVTVVHTDSTSKMIEYALSDNDSVGTTDTVKLAEIIRLNPIETPSLYKVSDVTLKPLESVLEPQGAPAAQAESKAFGGKSEQIVLRFDKSAHTQTLTKLEKIGKHLNLSNNTAIITELINERFEDIEAQA